MSSDDVPPLSLPNHHVDGQEHRSDSSSFFLRPDLDCRSNSASLPIEWCQLRALPSPASVTDALSTPTLTRKLAGPTARSSYNALSQYTQPETVWTPPPLIAEHSSVSTAFPDARYLDRLGESSRSPLAAPVIMDDVKHADIGGALAPISDASTVFVPSRKTDPGLRLPSFEALGIAAPHSSGTASSKVDTAADLGENAELEPIASGGRAVQNPVQHYVATLTPPAEKSEPTFDMRPTIISLLSSPEMDCSTITAGDGIQASATTVVSNNPHPVLVPITNAPASLTPESPGMWIEGALNAISANVQAASGAHSEFKILSHAMPYISPEGHIYPAVLDTIGQSIPNTINVCHAIPGKFNLADLPKSPPTTPISTAIVEEDYFNQKVFFSAAHLPEQPDHFNKLPRSPRPIVAPSSIHLSIVERYIPPSSPHELKHMFNVTGPSILVDRLVELSPRNGSLIFVYPTSTGAQTFMKEYLSPILDPQLRSMVVVHGLSADLGRSLGGMAAIDRLPGYEMLHDRIAKLCAELSQTSSSMPRLYGNSARFEMTYASKQRVALPRAVWARDWWVKQEKPRVRDIMTRYVRDLEKRNHHERAERTATAAELIQGLLDGVASKPYEPNKSPASGIEVGVFVIQRSK